MNQQALSSFFLLERLRRVFASCTTPEQLVVARRYLALAWPRLPRQGRAGLLGELNRLAACPWPPIFGPPIFYGVGEES